MGGVLDVGNVQSLAFNTGQAKIRTARRGLIPDKIPAPLREPSSHQLTTDKDNKFHQSHLYMKLTCHTNRPTLKFDRQN